MGKLYVSDRWHVISLQLVLEIKTPDKREEEKKFYKK